MWIQNNSTDHAKLSGCLSTLMSNDGNNRSSLQNFLFSDCILKQVQNLSSLMYDIPLSEIYRMGTGYFEFIEKHDLTLSMQYFLYSSNFQWKESFC